MKMICEFCGVRTSSFGLDMRDLLRLVPRLEDVAVKSAFEDAARTSPRWVIRPKDGSKSPSRGMTVYQVSAQHSPDDRGLDYSPRQAGRRDLYPPMEGHDLLRRCHGRGISSDFVIWRCGRPPPRDQRTSPCCRSRPPTSCSTRPGAPRPLPTPSPATRARSSRSDESA